MLYGVSMLSVPKADCISCSLSCRKRWEGSGARSLRYPSSPGHYDSKVSMALGACSPPSGHLGVAMSNHGGCDWGSQARAAFFCGDPLIQVGVTMGTESSSIAETHGGLVVSRRLCRRLGLRSRLEADVNVATTAVLTNEHRLLGTESKC